MWFFFAIASVLLWGGADLFYKIGSDQHDRYSHLKIVVFVGGIMGLHAFIYMFAAGISYDPMNILRYFPVSLLYILSMVIGYVGLRYIELSVASPIGNSSGAVAFVLCYIFLGEDMTALQFAAAAVVSVGIFMLSLMEKRKRTRNMPISKEDRKYQIGAIAIIFPILYCVIDGLGTFADAITLDRVMDEDQALLSYEFTFLAAALAAGFYLIVIKKQKLRWPKQKEHAAAGVLETAGQIFYVRALAENAVLTAPLVACYSIVSVLLSRIFLKEKLTAAQYAVIAVVMAAIAALC